MRVFSAAMGVAGLLLSTMTSFASSIHPHHHSSAHPIVRRSAVSHTSYSAHHTEVHGYERISMSPERATEIQSALIKQGVLSGDPSGVWDSTTVAAMQRFQSDNGWQTKLVPDSRALIKLGLGPGSEPVTPIMPVLNATASGSSATN